MVAVTPVKPAAGAGATAPANVPVTEIKALPKTGVSDVLAYVTLVVAVISTIVGTAYLAVARRQNV